MFVVVVVVVVVAANDLWDLILVDSLVGCLSVCAYYRENCWVPAIAIAISNAGVDLDVRVVPLA